MDVIEYAKIYVSFAINFLIRPDIKLVLNSENKKHTPSSSPLKLETRSVI